MKKKLNKSTISVYYSTFFGMYAGYDEYFSISFYGIKADELRKKWGALIQKKEKEYKEKQTKEKEEEIKKLKDELAVTPYSWFNKKRKFLEKQIKETEQKTLYSIGEGYQYYLSFQFINGLNGILISTGDKTKIYQV